MKTSVLLASSVRVSDLKHGLWSSARTHSISSTAYNFLDELPRVAFLLTAPCRDACLASTISSPAMLFSISSVYSNALWLPSTRSSSPLAAFPCVLSRNIVTCVTYWHLEQNAHPLLLHNFSCVWFIFRSPNH